MNLDKFNTFIYIITIFVSNVIQAKNSCLQEWFDMKAYNAIDNEFTNNTLQITIYVEAEDSHKEYNGNYSTTIPYQLDNNNTILIDAENIYNLNDEPFFSNENGNYCVWKQDTGVWWIGNCTDIGQDTGYAYMKDCKCPWASFSQNDEYDERCHTCTWSKYSNNETMKCDEDEDYCEFGTGFKGIDYDETFAFVGHKCFEHIEASQHDKNDTTGNLHISGGNTPDHNPGIALLKQQIRTFSLPSAGGRCRAQGGVLRLYKNPPPRIIRCVYPRVNCQWDSWNSWQSCSKSCGGGTQKRTRSKLVVAQNGGNGCSNGSNNETRSCNTNNCPASLCLTKNGPSSNQPCIFPFTFRGKTYNGCPIDPDDSRERWCSTKVDSRGRHIGGQGNYGNCNSKCPIEN